MPRFLINVKSNKLKEGFSFNSLVLNQVNYRGWLIAIIVGLVICSLCYLWQINSLATKGYKIKDLENKVAELKNVNKRLELNVTELRSTARINQAIEKLQMVSVARVEYLSANGTSVAINR